MGTLLREEEVEYLVRILELLQRVKVRRGGGDTLILRGGGGTTSRLNMFINLSQFKGV